MSTFPLHQSLLDNIFDRLEEASNIILDFTVCDPKESSVLKDDFMVNTVNGFKTDADFSDHLWVLTDEATWRIMEVIPTLAKDQHVHFLTDAHKRSELLLKIVQKEHAFDPVKGSRDTWLFVNPAFRCNDINGIPPWLRVQLIRRAHFFAYSWKKVIRNLVTDLRYIVTSCKYPLHDLNPAEQAKITRLKLHLGVPVAQYGCFMWAASNLKIMVSESVSELIRIAAAICNTPKSPEISSKSLRNHFDNPNPEAIRATIIDLQRIMQVLRDRLKSIDSVMIVMDVIEVMA